MIINFIKKKNKEIKEKKSGLQGRYWVYAASSHMLV
jgi:hypothetical protein